MQTLYGCALKKTASILETSTEEEEKMSPFWQGFIVGVIIFLFLPIALAWLRWFIQNLRVIREMWLLWPEWYYFLREGIRAGGGSMSNMPQVNRNFQIALRRKAERTGHPRIKQLADQHLAWCLKRFGPDFL